MTEADKVEFFKKLDDLYESTLELKKRALRLTERARARKRLREERKRKREQGNQQPPASDQGSNS